MSTVELVASLSDIVCLACGNEGLVESVEVTRLNYESIGFTPTGEPIFQGVEEGDGDCGDEDDNSRTIVCPSCRYDYALRADELSAAVVDEGGEVTTGTLRAALIDQLSGNELEMFGLPLEGEDA